MSRSHTYFLSCCRILGLPVRYVSGYLFMTQNTAEFAKESSLLESHAWADVYLPETGWVSFDISNGVRTSRYHVRLAICRLGL